MRLSRRGALAGGVGLAGAAAAGGVLGPLGRVARASAPGEYAAEFPSQHPDLVRELVGAAHTRLDRVTELVTARPALARATWDWGFGDWESALGAASHMGRRDIAEVLLAHGARPDIFSAAMLGQTAVVRAFIEAAPGVQRTPGPHGISLLRHARAGGEAAAGTAAYLESLGDADPAGESIDLEEAVLDSFVGTYRFGPGETEVFEVVRKDGAIRLGRPGRPARFLTPVEPAGFRPSGAERVRIRFRHDGDRVAALVVHDPDPLVTALRE